MGKAVDFLFGLFDLFIVLGLVIKVLLGDADVMDYVGLAAASAVGISCVHSWFTQKNAEDAVK